MPSGGVQIAPVANRFHSVPMIWLGVVKQFGTGKVMTRQHATR